HRMHMMLGFPGNRDNIDKTYKMRLPQTLLSSDAAKGYTTIEQPLSTVYKLSNLRQVQVRSSTLPCVGEHNAQSFDTIIMSIDVNTDMVLDRLEYIGQSNGRYFDLMSDAGITSINFSIWLVYDNGTTLPALLPSFTYANMLVKFIKK